MLLKTADEPVEARDHLPSSGPAPSKCVHLSLLKTRFERIDGVVRQGLDTRQCLRIVRLAVCRARPSRAKHASASHCNRKRISKGFVEGARRLTRANDPCTRAGSSRSSVQHTHFARASGTTWAGPGSPLLAHEP